METYVKLVASVLMCLLVAACDTGAGSENPGGQQPGVDIKPVAVSEQVAAFFDTHLPPVYLPSSEIFFVDERDYSYNGVCLAINSTEELISIMHTPVEPPEIDFGRNTLIIGFVVVGQIGHTVVKQSLDIDPSMITVNLDVKQIGGGYQSLARQYYWGLYPKCEGNAIIVNLTYKIES